MTPQKEIKSVKFDRDLLISTAWQLGIATNHQIGEKLRLTYSAVFSGKER
jgi:hypothetical protein